MVASILFKLDQLPIATNPDLGILRTFPKLLKVNLNQTKALKAIAAFSMLLSSGLFFDSSYTRDSGQVLTSLAKC